MHPPTSAQRWCKESQDPGQEWVSAASHRDQVFFPNFKVALNHERTAHDRGCAIANNDGTDGIHIPENNLRTTDETDWDKIGQPRLTTEGLRQWEMHAHVDHVFDLVPFWRRGIDAAEKGEVLRLEEFLDKMEGDGGWRTANDVLGMLGGWDASPLDRACDCGGPTWSQPNGDDWGANAFNWAASQRSGWDVQASNRIASDVTESSRRDSGWGIQEEWALSEVRMSRGKTVAVRDGRGTRGQVQAVRNLVGSGGGREELHNFVDAIARQEAVNEDRRQQMHLFFEMPMEQKIKKIEETIRILRTHAL